MATRVVATVSAPWHRAQVSEANARAPIPKTVHLDLADTARWVAARPAGALTAARWVRGVATNVVQGTPWTWYSRYPLVEPTVPWGLSTATDHQAASHWTFYARSPALVATGPWVLSRQSDGESTGPWGEYAGRLGRESAAKWATAATADKERWHPWTKFSRSVDPGWMVVIPLDPDDPDVPGALVVVPVQRVYIVINSASLVRVDGGIQIPMLAMSMSLDVDSWTWTASASLPGRALDAVAPDSSGTPVEVEATINGVPYRFLVETINRDRTFNQSALKIGMRGKTALLDAPYAMTQSFGNTGPRTMAQLAEDVLTVNGVAMGWAVNWTPEAWTVPTGAFSHQGTYIGALNALAGASGAYVQPHRTLQELSVLSRYPTAPWDWPGASPDFELPSAVTVQEGIEWVNRPNYNRVFVSGVSQGVLGQVTRLPTAGDIVAPMVTDALITDAVAVRLRGLPVLADTGRIAKVSLKLPVLPATGIIEPGKMVRYVDGAVTRIGICRSVAVSLGANAVDLRQTITVETHE